MVRPGEKKIITKNKQQIQNLKTKCKQYQIKENYSKTKHFQKVINK